MWDVFAGYVLAKLALTGVALVVVLVAPLIIYWPDIRARRRMRRRARNRERE